MSQKQNWEKIIYLAEDDEDDRLLFADAVEELNLPILVVQTADGCELLETLEKAKHLPETIFLDINMPRKNGFECLKEIRNGGSDFKNIKIIMLSTSSSAMHIRTAYNLGADYYAVKPPTFMELKDLLKGILDRDLKSLRKEMEKKLPAC